MTKKTFSIDYGKELIASGRTVNNGVEHYYRVYKLLVDKSTTLKDYLSCISLPDGIDHAVIHICDKSEYEDHNGHIHILNPQTIKCDHGVDDRNGILFASNTVFGKDLLKAHGDEIIKYAIKVSHTTFDKTYNDFIDLIFVLEKKITMYMSRKEFDDYIDEITKPFQPMSDTYKKRIWELMCAAFSDVNSN